MSDFVVFFMFMMHHQECNRRLTLHAGTSPLYVYSSTFTSQPSWDDLVGALSIIIWSITLIVTIKYTFIVLSADDDGQGGKIDAHCTPKILPTWILLADHVQAHSLSTRCWQDTRTLRGRTLRQLPLFTWIATAPTICVQLAEGSVHLLRRPG